MIGTILLTLAFIIVMAYAICALYELATITKKLKEIDGRLKMGMTPNEIMKAEGLQPIPDKLIKGYEIRLGDTWDSGLPIIEEMKKRAQANEGVHPMFWKDIIPEKEWYTVSEAAVEIGCHRRKVYKLIKRFCENYYFKTGTYTHSQDPLKDTKGHWLLHHTDLEIIKKERKAK